MLRQCQAQFCAEAMSSTIARVFQRGTFLESRVTYGGADSGAICKEPLLQWGWPPHPHPKTLVLETSLTFFTVGVILSRFFYFLA